MSRRFTIALVVCAVMVTLACAGSAYRQSDQDAEQPPRATHAEPAPSDCAAGMPGAVGTIEFKPADWREGETTYWIDTDGIAPATPGCHVGTDSEGEPNGRMFGEACLEDGRLVESNPGGYKIHKHTDDLGHPDTFDCDAWCVATGASGGGCEMVGPDAAPPCERSAYCACG